MAQNSKKQSTAGRVFLIVRIIGRIAIYIAVIVLLITVAKSSYTFGYSVFANEAMSPEPGKDVVVTVTKGMTDQEVGELLENKGLVKDSLVFVLQAKVYSYQIYPGTYVLNTSQTVAEMVDLMAQEHETAEDNSIIPTTASEEEETGTGD